VPKEVEGLPVKTAPPKIIELTSHTGTNQVETLGGSVLISDPRWEPQENAATLGAVVLSQGQPWGVTVAHPLFNCDTAPPCRPCDPPNSCTNIVTPLNKCPHYSSAGAPIDQPPVRFNGVINTNARQVGIAPRWTPLSNNSTASDVSAIFLDNNTVEKDGSLKVGRTLEVYSDTGTFKGTEGAPPSVNDNILLVNSVTNSGGQGSNTCF